MRKFATIVAFGLVAASFVAMPAPAAQAADVVYSYAARTGGTYVKVFDGTVNSDFTAAVERHRRTEFGRGEEQHRSGHREQLAPRRRDRDRFQGSRRRYGHKAGVVRSHGERRPPDGLITVGAVETNVSTVGRSDGTASSTGDTKLVGINIVGVDLPIRIPKNYAVTIPGLANITLNVHLHGKVGTTVATQAWAIGVTLLKPRAGYKAGVTVIVNPINQYLAESEPATGAKIRGQAYGTRVQANVGDDIEVVSDPTALVSVPYGSSHGKTLKNQTLGVNVPGLLTTGVVSSTTNSTKDDVGNASIRNANETAGLNLLGGLIKADVIKVTAVGKMQDGKWTSRMTMTTVNLVVAGQQIPINVGPNTIIDVAGLGTVAINLQQKNPHGAPQNRITGVKITLDTERAGLPIGAVIELGVATTTIG